MSDRTTININNIDNIVEVTFKEEFKELYYNMKKIYKLIKHIKYIPKHTFNNLTVTTPYCGESLYSLSLEDVTKIIIKNQVIDFVQEIYKANIVHRDLHTKNICWDGNQIWVIDWELSSKCKINNIINHYDLTGTGMKSPYKSNKMNVFRKKYGKCLVNWLKPINISLKEFEL